MRGLVVFEVAIDAGPERRVFDEAPLRLVVKVDLGVRSEYVAYVGEVLQRDAARPGAVGGA